MVQKLVLFDKIYNIGKERNKKEIIHRYLNYLNNYVKGFPNTSVEVKKIRDFDKRPEIIITGPEEYFILNLLKKEIGIISDFKDLKVGEIYKGILVDVGKVGFGLFADCAILNPKVDVLINLHTLRRQLCAGKKNSLRNIIEAYNFIDNFPVYVKINKIDIINNKLQGELAEHTLSLFNKILKDNLEGVFLSGDTKGQFKKAITKKGHFRDIITIEQFGFLENIALFKEGTNAPGIIAHIGSQLESTKLSALRPERIKKLFI